MTLPELLTRLEELDVHLWREGDRLRFNAPKGAMTPELAAELRAHKAALLARLGEATAPARPRAAGEKAARPPLSPLPRRELAPLFYPQRRLWFLNRLAPESPAYNIPASWHLTGPVSLEAMAASLTAVVERHEILRTRFVLRDGEPFQRVLPPAPMPLPVIDLRALPEAVRSELASTLREREAVRPFDLEEQPLIRARILRLAAEDHVVLLSVHHIAADAWSMGLLTAELGAVYEARRQGRRPALPALPIQYLDYVEWQRVCLEGEALAPALAWWRQRLAGAPGLLELPTDRPRPSGFSDRGAELVALVPDRLAAAAEAGAQRGGLTLFTLLLATFTLALHKVSAQSDLVVGVPVAGRDRVEVEHLIGLFINTLALRLDLSGDPPFEDLLDQVRTTLVEAQSHQEVPFEMLVEELHPERSLSYSPLVQVLFQLQSGEAARGVAEIPASSLRRPSVVPRPSKLDLEIALARHPAGLMVRWLYRSDLFDATTMIRWLEGWKRLLAGGLEAPETPLSALGFLSRGERQQLLRESNDTATGSGWGRVDEPVPSRFERQAARTPDRVAVRQGEACLSYGALEAESRALAGRLRRLGLGPEVAVALGLERSPALPAALLGIWRAGGFYVPLDPSYPAERIAFMLADAAPAVLVTEGGTLPALPPFDGQVVRMDEQERTAEGVPAAAAAAPEQLAYVIYTSGSTGRPKGVAIPHGALSNFLAAMAAAPGLSPEDRLLAVTSLSFDIAGLELYLPLVEGAQVVLASREEAADGARLAALLARSRATVLQATPATWRLLSDSGWEGEPGLSALCGGEALPGEVAAAVLPRAAALWNLYGPTETTVWSSLSRLDAAAAASPVVPLGRPIANTWIHLVDRRGRPVALGVAGELLIGGAGLARGYRGRPGLTAERFVPDGLDDRPGARLYRTGDLARRRADGQLEYLGRLDHQVKLRGFRIELGEIEGALRRHPAVANAVVTVAGRRAEDGAGGDGLLAAYVVQAVGGAPDESELREHLRAQLPEYMLPAAWVFLDALPLTPNRKVDRKALPPPQAEARSSGYVAPQTPAEEMLAAVWGEVLGRERIGSRDDFFALGGHSLLAAQVLARVARDLGVELPVAAIFEARTVAALARRLAEDRGAPALPPVVPVPREERIPLTAQQERLWFLDQVDPGTNAFNLHLALPVDGELEVARLEGAIHALVTRHESLRTRFEVADGQPFQVVDEELDLPLPVIDLSALPGAAISREAGRLERRHVRQSFRLDRGPLFALTVVRLGDRGHSLLLAIHHVATDGWSMGLILAELSSLYEATASGRSAELPPLPVQYPDFAVWQRQRLESGQLEPQLEYWRRHLAGVPPLLALPADRPRPAVQTFRGADLAVRPGRRLSEAIRALGRRSGASPFMTLLTAWLTLLHRLSGDTDLCVGTYSAGRTRTELEGVMGYLVNTLALRTDAAGDPPFQELLGRVREVCLQAYAHQDLPFESLVDALKPERSLSHWPFFQVMVVYQNIPILDEELTTFTVPTESPHGFGRANYDLTLWLWEAGGEIRGMLSYSADLFDRTTAMRLRCQLLRLLTEAVAEPGTRLRELPLLSPSERHALLFDWNDSRRSPARESPCLEELLALAAERTPAAVAVVGGQEHLSYGLLGERAHVLAGRLRGAGVGAEVAVGVLTHRSPAMLVAMLGTLRSGGFYVPLDPAHPAERRAFLLGDAGIRVVVVEEGLGQDLSEGWEAMVELDAGGFLPPSGSPEPPHGAIHTDPAHPAYAIYTSGSTGEPKGVLVQRSALLNHTLSAMADYGLGPGDWVLQFAAFSFDASAEEIFPTLASGATLVLREDAMIDSIAGFAAAVERLAITVLDLPTAFWHGMMAGLAAAGGASPGRLRLVILGGEEVSPEHLATWHRLMGDRGVRLVNTYGPTEATIVATRWDLGRPAPVGEEEPWRVAIGRGIDNAQTVVLDPSSRPVAMGVAGELCLGGAGLARGYLGRPGLTAASFVPDPFTRGRGDRLYRSGDLARFRADGELEFLGRRDRQVKVRGFRIEPGEIEARLARHPAVGEAVVAVREDDSGDPRLVAWLVPTGAVRPTVTELRDHLAEALPSYMLPGAFVTLEALPRTPSGKIDRRALPAPETTRPELAEEYSAPSTAIEERLAEIWCEVLRLDGVGRSDNFFHLGGHSMLAVRVTARVREIFEIDLEVLALFEMPTIARLAEAVEERLLELVEEMSDDEVEALL